MDITFKDSPIFPSVLYGKSAPFMTTRQEVRTGAHRYAVCLRRLEKGTHVWTCLTSESKEETCKDRPWAHSLDSVEATYHRGVESPQIVTEYLTIFCASKLV